MNSKRVFLQTYGWMMTPRAWTNRTILAAILLCALSASVSAGPSASGASLPVTTGWISDLLSGERMWMWFIAAFAGGVALNLTPCVFPMIPVTLAFFSGQASGRISYLVTLGALYVLGMSLTYALLGSLASATGALLGSWLQQPVVLLGVAGMVVALALSMFGMYELRPPARFAQRFGSASAGRWGALVMGLTVGIIAAPCIGPFVLGLLLFIAQQANPQLGFGLFFTMGLGMGIPFLLLGLFANRLSHWPKVGAALVWSKKVLGIVLCGLALYFLKPLMAAGVFAWLVVMALVAAGIYLGWLERSVFHAAGRWIRRLVGLVLVGAAIAFVPARGGDAGARVSWQSYSAARLAQAARDGRPALVDLYADWCLPCVELDHVTFRSPDVVQRLSTFVALRVDATQAIPPEAEELLDRYGIYGVPTVLLFDAQGREHSDLRINGFIRPQEFLAQLDRLETP